MNIMSRLPKNLCILTHSFHISRIKEHGQIIVLFIVYKPLIIVCNPAEIKVICWRVFMLRFANVQ